jgi:myo-inositol-1(or 4)-monophosphatase
LELDANIPPMTTDKELAAFAIELAMAARHETLRLSHTNRKASNKASEGLYDPVTDADRASETIIREMISRRFPGHAIGGEEFPDTPGQGQFRWSIDPIDGTRSYICGLPTWTTLIGLLESDVPVLGLIDAPCLDEIYIADTDAAALIRNGVRRPIFTSGCKNVNEARFSTTDPYLFGSSASRLERLLGAVRVTRFGHDAYAYASLAAGNIDLVVECGLKPHDYNALIPVVRAANGHFGDWSGGDDFSGGNVIAAASRELYEAAVELLAE